MLSSHWSHFRVVFNAWPECVRNRVKVLQCLTLLVAEMLHNMALEFLQCDWSIDMSHVTRVLIGQYCPII